MIDQSASEVTLDLSLEEVDLSREKLPAELTLASLPVELRSWSTSLSTCTASPLTSSITGAGMLTLPLDKAADTPRLTRRRCTLGL